LTKLTKTTAAEQPAPASLQELRERAHAALLRARAADSRFFEGEQERFYGDVNDVQRHCEPAFLSACLADWIRRFEALATRPSERPSPYIGWREAAFTLERQDTFLAKMSRPQVEHYRALRENRHDREAGAFLRDCEAGQHLLPPGFNLNPSPPNPLPDAINLVLRLRQRGYALGIDGDSITVCPATLSTSERGELQRLGVYVREVLTSSVTKVKIEVR
jgi:hypothetical protein